MDIQVTRRMGWVAAAVLSVFTVGCADVTDTFSSKEQAVTTSIDTDKDTYSPNEQIAVSFNRMSGSQLDWISIANASDPDTTFITYRYTEGALDGTFTFAGLPAGNYEARAYFNDSFQVEARSTFAVENPPVGTTISTDATSYGSGSTVTVNYTGLAGTSTDWISIAAPGSAPNSFVRFQYTNGQSDGSVQFAGLPNGNYVARSYNNDSFEIVKESSEFAIGNVISTNATTYNPGDNIVVNFQGLPPNPTNWIAISEDGAAPNSFVSFQYVSTASGQVTFAGLPSGNYEARVYLNDSYVIHGSSDFVVGTPPAPEITTDKASYVQGETLNATYTVTGDATDWVGISTAGSPDTSFITYQYVSPSGTASFNTQGLAAGNYEARLYASDGFTIRDSVAFEVTAPPAPPAVDITTTSATYTAADPVVVNYTSLGGPQDWVGIATVGSPDNTFVQFQYTNGVADGQLTFTGLAPGMYEARAYKNDSFTVEDRTTFEVTN